MELHEEVAGVFARMDALIDELGGTGLRIDAHTHLGLDEESLILPFSSLTGAGVRELWDVIREVVSSRK